MQLLNFSTWFYWCPILHTLCGSIYINVDFRATIFGEKLEKNEKKIHRFNVVRQINYVHGNKEEDFYYISFAFNSKNTSLNDKCCYSISLHSNICPFFFIYVFLSIRVTYYNNQPHVSMSDIEPPTILCHVYTYLIHTQNYT